MSQAYVIRYSGYCPICEAPATFSARGTWLRGSLTCETCPNGSVPRERALALVLSELLPAWRTAAIHECSPIKRGISAKIKREAANLTASQYYPGLALGAFKDGYRNEDLQQQTFSADSFDLFISLDVLEHIPDPQRAFSEIWRTLRLGGLMISTFPVRKDQVVPIERRASFDSNGTITHHKPAEYHGNPVSSEGSLVTVDYGYDIHQTIAEWAPFDVRVYRFCDREHGILGEYTDVFVCRKRPASV